MNYRAIFALVPMLLSAAPFGSVVTIGGLASDLALDERRQVVYLANFGARRLEVISMSDNSVKDPIPVAAQPACLALSPNARYLVVGHYAMTASGFAETPALTILDLDGNQRRTIALPAQPLAAAFGAGERALVVTTSGILLVEPSTAALTDLTPAGFAGIPIPVAAPNFPPQIIQASTAVSGNGEVIYVLGEGTGGQPVLRYEPLTQKLSIVGITSTPRLGPRVVSTDTRGERLLAGWALMTPDFVQLAQFPYPSGTLQTGSHVMDDEAGIIYGQLPRADGEAPVLSLFDTDNLTLRERIQLRENLAGRSLLTRDRQTMYAISDSGLTVLPVGQLARYPRVASLQEDVVIRSNFCSNTVINSTIDIVDPGGNATPYRITGIPAGVRILVNSPTTPARAQIEVDPSVFRNLRGTAELFLDLESPTAINLPRRIRLLVTAQEPEQRGAVVNVPGRLVDILADPVRPRIYVLRQDRNEVRVFDANRLTQTAVLRTGNTPMQMAITADARYLITTADNSQIAHVFDLDTLQPSTPIQLPFGHYPRSIAATASAILITTRSASGPHSVDRVQFNSRIANRMPSLGIFLNDIRPESVLAASPSGRYIYSVDPSGLMMMYDATADTFVAARRQTEAPLGGLGVISEDLFAVGNRLFNRSLAPAGTLQAVGTAAGYASADGAGIRVGASGAAGILNRIDTESLQLIAPIPTVEAPVTANPTTAAPPGQVGQTLLPFTRSLAVLPNGGIVVLSTSGFTVLPYDFDAPVTSLPPVLTGMVNIADNTPAVAPGSLVSISGRRLSVGTAGTDSLPLPTLLAQTCVSAGDVFMPLSFASSTELRGQVPYTVSGRVRFVARTPNGNSEPFEVNVTAGAPAIFRTGTAGPLTRLPTVYRADNDQLVTDSNPVNPGDELRIILTGLGRTSPLVADGAAAPGDPLARSANPSVTIGGSSLDILFAGLIPGQAGIYQISAYVPATVPEGPEVPLKISLGGVSTEIIVRVLK